MSIKSGVETNLNTGSLSLRDELISLEPNLSLSLFFLISNSGIAATLFSPKKNKFLSLDTVSFVDDKKQESIEQMLKYFLEERNLLKQGNVSNTRVVLVTDRHTLLPSSFYTDADANVVFDFNFNRDENTQVLSCPVPSFDVQVIYGAENSVVNSCKEAFTRPVFTPHLVGLMESFYLQYKKVSSPVLLLNVRQDAIDVIVKENRKLILANTFRYKTPEDVLYYTLNVYEQLQLNPENEKLIVAGLFETNSILYNLLQKYIRNVEPAERPSMIEYSYVLNEFPAHAHFQLYSQVLCAS